MVKQQWDSYQLSRADMRRKTASRRGVAALSRVRPTISVSGVLRAGRDFDTERCRHVLTFAGPLQPFQLVERKGQLPM